MDVIKPEKWSPLYNLETIFMSIIALLSEPNIESPFNMEASRLYAENQKHPENYKKICQDYYWQKINAPEHKKFLTIPFSQS